MHVNIDSVLQAHMRQYSELAVSFDIRHTFDFVLLRIHPMPGNDGVQRLRRLPGEL